MKELPGWHGKGDWKANASRDDNGKVQSSFFPWTSGWQSWPEGHDVQESTNPDTLLLARLSETDKRDAFSSMGAVGKIWWTHHVPASKGGSALGIRTVMANSLKGGLWGVWPERRPPTLQINSLAITSQEENGKVSLQLKWELWDQLRVADEWLVLKDRCKIMVGTSKQSVGTATAQKGLRF